MDNNGFGTVTAFMAGAASINAVAAISKKHSPAPILFAAAGLYTLLVLIGYFTRWEWVKPFAGIIFLLSVLSNAFPLIAGILNLVQGVQLQSAKNKNTTSQAQAPVRR
jgi:Co/Zn/Cd efflux system component